MTDTERLSHVGEKMKDIYPLVWKALSQARHQQSKDKLKFVEPLDLAEGMLQSLSIPLYYGQGGAGK